MDMEKVLIAEDDPNFRDALETMVSAWGYTVVSASQGMDAWKLLQEDDAPKLTILDWIMPGMDGVEICRRLRSRQNDPYTYVILLTIQDQVEHLTEGFSAGADDFLTKPVMPTELQARLLAGRRILEMQKELISAREALRQQATRDPLTLLWNRGGIIDFLHREVGRASRSREPLTVIMMDVDNFKQTNDTYGHLAGDAILVEVSRRIEDSLRSYDAIGRYGGDEFIIVLPNCDTESGLSLAERIRRKVTGPSMVMPDESFSTNVSMGVATTSKGTGLSVNGLIGAADAALLRAKKLGRDRAELYTPLLKVQVL
jgi:diguanylate cyclase (GGDEF)-like protein